MNRPNEVARNNIVLNFRDKPPSVIVHADRNINRNDELQSEYSETISVLSDTDEELLEIERKEYPSGLQGKELAYRDIETVFDELENDKLLDPFTRWKPKEDIPDTIRGPKFVPKRPTALPRSIPSTVQSHESADSAPAPNKKASKSLTKSGNDSNWKKSGKIKVPESPDQRLPSVGAAILPRRRDCNTIASPRKSIVAKLLMEANDEATRKKKQEEEQKAKEQAESLARLRSSIGSADTSVLILTEGRPLTQSSCITELDDKESSIEFSRPHSPMDPRPLSREQVVTLDEIQKYAAGSCLNPKQQLSKDEHMRRNQVEIRRDLKTLHNLSPLVTNEEELSKVKRGPRGTTTTLVDHKTQYELKVAASVGISTPPERPLNRQEELILELADSKRGKSKSMADVPFLGSSDGRKKRGEADKTTFKIIYKEPRWPHQVTLDKMVDRLFRVKHLVLDDSQLKSLRDITSLLPSLTTLSVKSCGLKTLDGTLAFPNLQKLFASDNELTHASQCSLLSELQELDLSGNPIESLDDFRYLGVLNFLRIIKLYDTKVSEGKHFHTELRRIIPSVRDIFPKSKPGDFYEFDIEDEDYLTVDSKLLGYTSGESVRRGSTADKDFKRIPSIFSSSSGSKRKLIEKNATKLINARESSEENMKLQSLIATMGDSETEADLEEAKKASMRDLKELYQYVASTGTDKDGGMGDADIAESESGTPEVEKVHDNVANLGAVKSTPSIANDDALNGPCEDGADTDGGEGDRPASTKDHYD